MEGTLQVTHSLDQERQIVGKKKRLRNSPDTPTFNKRQTRINDYWLNRPIRTNNIYEKLINEETQETNAENNSNNIKEDETTINHHPIS